MKNILLVALAIIGFTLQSCGSSKSTTKEYWVNSYKVNCTGVAPMNCLLVSTDHKLENATWTNFYDNIEGFNFEPGYFKRISVKEEKIDPSSVPADASSIRYTLIKELEKREDKAGKLNGEWYLVRLNKNKINRMGKVPSLIIDLGVGGFSGVDGCNNYSGTLKRLGEDQLVVGVTAKTQRMCADMDIPSAYQTALQQVKSFTFEDDILVLRDAEGSEVLAFIPKR